MGRLTASKQRLTAAPSRLGPAIVDGQSRDKRRYAKHPWRKWYGTARWKKLAKKIRKRDNSTCRQTGELLIGGRHEPNSGVVDHIIPHRGDPELFWDESNLQLVSKAWHDKEKQRQELRGEY